MRIQVVHCHPLDDSFNHAIFSGGGGEQWLRRFWRRRLCRGVKEREGHHLCYPHWRLSMPAVLKGYVDRVWGPRMAFIYDATGNHLEPNLKRIRLLGVVTTFGSPWWVVRLFAGDGWRTTTSTISRPSRAKPIWKR